MNLPDQAEFVVIGGGIIGCSTAYHLAREHKADVILLEQGRLTGGSTWHAAGLVGQLRNSASVTRLLQYSVSLYQKLEQETGLATGWKMTGCLRLARNQDRWIEFRRLATTARSFGMEMELLTPREVKQLWPLMVVDDLVGASFLRSDGQASPSDLTQSLARGARMHGARLFEGVCVAGFTMKADRITAVRTEAGDIACEKVINCAGIWSRQIGAMAGVNVPVQPVRHQYVITDRIAGLAPDTPTVRDPDRRTYFKEEVGGLVMGGYEPDPQPWDVEEVPGDWQFRLFDDDFDHFQQHMEQALRRVPAMADVGVKQMINGAEAFTPDGNFILGAAPECANMFVGTGFNAFGIASGGGAGQALAHWAATGSAPFDLWTVDIRRFANVHRDRDWVCERTREACARHYEIAWPHEEYESARPALVSPFYERLRARDAVFGSKLGWERANWFAPAGVEPRDENTMGRPNWLEPVAAEHRHVREHVGLFDQSSFAKFELSGPAALEALSYLCANDVARPPGSLIYTQLCNENGGIEADLTMARLAGDRFYIVTGTGFRTHDFAWIAEHLPRNGVSLRDVTEEWAVLSLMGPDSRRVLARVTNADLRNDAFPFGQIREIAIAGRMARALRVSYVGELGWELHMPVSAAGAIFDALMETGEQYKIRLAGYRALESLRLEKFYRAWSTDITPNDTPLEAGLGWAVKLRRSGVDFLGRSALAAQAEGLLRKKLVLFTLEDREAILLGRETILRNGEPVGYLTSGGFGHTVGLPIGIGYVRNEAGVTDEFLNSGEYALIAAMETLPARLHTRPLHDPASARMKV